MGAGVWNGPGFRGASFHRAPRRDTDAGATSVAEAVLSP